MVIFLSSLLGRRMSGGTGYPARYSAHASFTVRLSRPKPFAAAILREDDNIGWSREEKI
jgi:hypothetical protein